MNLRTYGLRGIVLLVIGAAVAVLSHKFDPDATPQPSPDPRTAASPETSAEIRPPNERTDETRELSVFELKELIGTLILEAWPDRLSRIALRAALKEFAAKHPREFLQWITTVRPLPDTQWAIDIAISGLAGVDDRAALEYVGRLRTPSLRIATWAALIRSTTLQNPTNGVALLGSVEPQFRARLTSVLAKEWAAQDPAGAVRFISSMSPSAVRGQLLSMNFSKWAAKDPDAALAWAQENKIQRSLINSLAENGMPALAARVLDATPIRNKETYLRDLARSWAQQSPAAAFEWAVGQDNPRDKAIMLRSLLDNVARQDIQVASQILDFVPSADLKQGFYRSLAERYVSSDPHGLIDWGISLTDASARLDATRIAFGTWAARDPQASLQYAATIAATEMDRESWVSAVLDRVPRKADGSLDPRLSSAISTLPISQQRFIQNLIGRKMRP